MANLIHSLHFLVGNGLDRWLPAFPYIGIMLALLVSFMLFLSVKTEVRQTASRTRKNADRESKRVNRALVKLAEVAAAPSRSYVSAPEPIYIPVAAPAGFPVTGFNINRRVQALRMLRRGEDIAHIAAALAVSRREVELLIRMQQIVSQARPQAEVLQAEVTPAVEMESAIAISEERRELSGTSTVAAGLTGIETGEITSLQHSAAVGAAADAPTTQLLMSLNLPTIRRSSTPPAAATTQGLLRRRTVAALA